jgi:NADPH:quinone reductase-like Zn-dependent oxidoreductase
MKAIVYYTYGSPDVLQLAEVAKPTPKDDEVLVKIQAASVNSWDWDLVRGKPPIYRLLFGLRKPTVRIIGSDIAGYVEAVGRQVKQFDPGDAVYGDISACGFGAFAEYASVKADALALKPAGMTFEQAAATPQAGLLAYQGLLGQRAIQPGQTVLINGAGGGVGTFAIQIAKWYGAEVTGVDSTAKLALMRSLGADHVIDYTKADYTQRGQRYDLILDVIAERSIFAYQRVLTPTGLFVMVGGAVSTILQAVFLGAMLSKIGGQKLGILAHRANKELALLQEFFETGKVAPVIDRCYPLAETAEAFRYFGQGHAKGKVVITMTQIIEPDNFGGNA